MDMPKGIHYLELTKEKAQELWQKVSELKIWDDYTVNRPEVFFQNLLSRNSIWLERDDGNGILYLMSIIPGLSASGHVVYWDRKLRGREAETLEALCWVMEDAMLQKVNLFIPDYAKSVRSFARRMGFRQEGCIRRWSYSQGKTFDVYVMGILREEAFKALEEIDGSIHGTPGDEVQSTEQGIREPVSGLDQSTDEPEDAGDPDIGASSE